MASNLIRISRVQPIHDQVVELGFNNGEVGQVDLRQLMQGPVFRELLTSPAKFREVRVDTDLGTIVWPNGADLCPDVIYAASKKPH